MLNGLTDSFLVDFPGPTMALGGPGRGRLAQLARALALQARCRGFESLNAHQVNQPYRSDPDFVVLHTLRCIGVAGEERVADASGLGIGETVAGLRDLSDQGLVRLDSGPFGGWGLTESGRITDQELVQDELDSVDGRDHVRSRYETFLGHNPTLLQICSDWQMRASASSVQHRFSPIGRRRDRAGSQLSLLPASLSHTRRHRLHS